MNRLLHISANVNKPVLLQFKVEKLARHTQRGEAQRLPAIQQWQLDATTTVEAYIEGGLSFNPGDETVRMPFAAPFLFTCITEKNGQCRLCWSQSLS